MIVVCVYLYGNFWVRLIKFPAQSCFLFSETFCSYYGSFFLYNCIIVYTCTWDISRHLCLIRSFFSELDLIDGWLCSLPSFSSGPSPPHQWRQRNNSCHHSWEEEEEAEELCLTFFHLHLQMGFSDYSQVRAVCLCLSRHRPRGWAYVCGEVYLGRNHVFLPQVTGASSHGIGDLHPSKLELRACHLVPRR